MNPAPPVTRTFVRAAPLGSPAHSRRHAKVRDGPRVWRPRQLPMGAGLRAPVSEYLEPSIRYGPHFSAGCTDLDRSDADPFHGPRVRLVGDDVADVDQTFRKESDPGQDVADHMLRAQTYRYAHDHRAGKNRRHVHMRSEER